MIEENRVDEVWPRLHVPPLSDLKSSDAHIGVQTLQQNTDVISRSHGRTAKNVDTPHDRMGICTIVDEQHARPIRPQIIKNERNKAQSKQARKDEKSNQTKRNPLGVQGSPPPLQYFPSVP